MLNFFDFLACFQPLFFLFLPPNTTHKNWLNYVNALLSHILAIFKSNRLVTETWSLPERNETFETETKSRDSFTDSLVWVTAVT